MTSFLSATPHFLPPLQAIQTYRATVTLLSHQKTFVKEMNWGEGTAGDGGG